METHTNDKGQEFTRQRENATVWFYICKKCGFTESEEDFNSHECEGDD